MRLTRRSQKTTTGSLGNESGQVILTIVVFMVVMILVTTAATLTTVVNTRNASIYEMGTRAYAIAESGAENALIILLRNPNYTGETLSLDGGEVVVTVNGSGSTRTVTSTSSLNAFSRTVRVQLTYTNSVMTVTSWREVY